MKRASLSSLKKRVVVAKEATAKTREKKRKRKASKKKEDQKPLVPNFFSDQGDCGQTQEQVLSSYSVQAWFREGITKRISWSFTLPSNEKWWGGKQRMLAKKLLDAYGGDVLERAVNYLCDNWEEMVNGSEGRLTGIPTVEFLWSGRDRIFPDAERGKPYVPFKGGRKRSLDADEYVEPEDEAIGHGW